VALARVRVKLFEALKQKTQKTQKTQASWVVGRHAIVIPGEVR